MNIINEYESIYRSDIVYEAGGRFGPRLQQSLLLVYIFKGEVLVHVDGRQEYLGEGEVTLMMPGRTERYLFAHDRPTHHGWSQIYKPQISDELYQRIDALPFRNVMSNRMREIDRMITDANTEALRDCLVHALFLEFFNIAGLNLEVKKEIPLHPAVDKAKAYIQTEFSVPLDLTTIASHAGITGAHLIRLFKDELATTPTEYLWNCRVNAAKRMLEETGLSSAEIAYRCGFATPAHFSRRFKQLTEQTPGRYRAQHWGR